MPSLVLEGGTFRPIFSCGVMDALLEENILFPYVIGVSAGISYGISYISKQKDRNIEIARKYRNDRRYLGFSNLKTQKSIFGIDFVFGEIPNYLDPFDWKTYLEYKGKLLVGVTNARTGKAEYLDGLKSDKNFTMFRATCAIPLVFPTIHLNGEDFYDGGIADAIPVQKAIKDGNKKHLIVLTRTKEYRKTLSKKTILAAKSLHKKYPAVEARLMTRYKRYNETVALCEELEQKNEAILLRPDYPIESLEKDVKTLDQTYQHGYEKAKTYMEDIKSLFQT